MGDRWYLDNLKCAYCKYKQLEEVYYAPTCNFITFKCEKCSKENFITSGFNAKKIKDVKFEEVLEAVSDASNFMDEKQITRVAEDMFKNLKRRK